MYKRLPPEFSPKLLVFVFDEKEKKEYPLMSRGLQYEEYVFEELSSLIKSLNGPRHDVPTEKQKQEWVEDFCNRYLETKVDPKEFLELIEYNTRPDEYFNSFLRQKSHISCLTLFLLDP